MSIKAKTKSIVVYYHPEEDPSQIAATAARSSGTKIAGNLRWYGRVVPSYLAARTSDGREVVAFRAANK